MVRRVLSQSELYHVLLGNDRRLDLPGFAAFDIPEWEATPWTPFNSLDTSYSMLLIC